MGHDLTCGGPAATKMAGRRHASVGAGALWPSVFGTKAFFPTVFPGFTWLDPFSFVLGLVEVALYGLAAAAVVMVAWNFVADRTDKAGA